MLTPRQLEFLVGSLLLGAGILFAGALLAGRAEKRERPESPEGEQLAEWANG